MSEACPDFIPEYLLKPVATEKSYGLLKEYEDGVEVIVEPPDVSETGLIINPTGYETRYPDGGVHFEDSYDENGEYIGIPTYFEDGIPKSSEG